MPDFRIKFVDRFGLGERKLTAPSAKLASRHFVTEFKRRNAPNPDILQMEIKTSQGWVTCFEKTR